MSWIKLDDSFADHPKIEALADSSHDSSHHGWLYVKGLCYAARHLTDGFIPKAFADRAVTEGEAIAADLVRVGLWENVKGGYQIHDYLDYNPSRETVATYRQSKRVGAVAGGKARAAGKRDETGKFTPAIDPADMAGVQGGTPIQPESTSPSPTPCIESTDCINTIMVESASNGRKAKKSKPEPSPEIAEIYDLYKELIQPKSRECPTSTIASRLRKFSAEELKECIRYFAADPWRMENNAHMGADWFFESDKQIRKWQLLPEKKKPAATRNGNGVNSYVASMPKAEEGAFDAYDD